jgi:hypothetical protein
VLRGVVGHVELEGLGEDEADEARGVAFVPVSDAGIDDEGIDEDDPVGRAGIVLDAARFAGAIATEEAVVVYTTAMQVQIQPV